MKTLVLGGARSGKSQLAEDLFLPGDQVIYVATARPFTPPQDVEATGEEHTAAPSHAQSHTQSDAAATSDSLAQSQDPAAEFDADFLARIDKHRQRRPGHWITIEDQDATTVLNECQNSAHILIDDLATWLTHHLDKSGAWDQPSRKTGGGSDSAPLATPLDTVHRQCDAFITALDAAPSDSTIAIVSAEVGLGIIPSHPAGGLFRDELGELNRRVAEVCDRVVLVVAGCEVELKAPTPCASSSAENSLD